LEQFNEIEEIDVANATVLVQAGCLLENVQQAVAEKGLLYPLDLGGRGSATVGGNVSSNAGGINVIRYGMMRNVTLGLEAVLADGTIVSSLNRMIKNNTGYDLKQLFIGSEGTLGVVTKVVVKLEEPPTTINTAMLSLSTFQNVLELLRHMRRCMGNVLNAFEYMDNDYYRAVTGEGGNRAPMDASSACYVVTEVRGNNFEFDEELFQETLAEAIELGIVDEVVIAQSERQRQEIWEVRENFEPILHNTPYFLYDVSLPIGVMNQYLKQVKSEILALWPKALCASLAHVGDNNLHFFIAPRAEGNIDEHDSNAKANEIVYAPLTELNGSVSAEHGIGIEKKNYLSMSRTPQELELMKVLKRTLDPNNILAPGRIFDLKG
jgi:FAD/FMN-containing dehydrogenase